MRIVARPPRWFFLLVLALVVPLGASAQEVEPSEDMEQFVDEELTVILDHAIEASDRLQSCLEGSSGACTGGVLQLGVALGRIGVLSQCCYSYWPDAAVERQLIERANAAVNLIQRPYGSLSRLPRRQALPMQAELVGFKAAMSVLRDEIQEEESGDTP